MTATSFLAQIEWSQPWLLPFREIAALIVQADDWRHAIDAAAKARDLRNHRGLPLRFVSQSELPVGIAYETFISETACIPTRDNLHDFFNALIWLAYPQTKARLNALQATAIAEAGTTAVRGRLRDALTIFDENAAIFMHANEKSVSALGNRQWLTLFIEERPGFGKEWTVQLFGHALLEKLVQPYKAITAHAWPVCLEQTDHGEEKLLPKLSDLDRVLATTLSSDISTRSFMPLPVLGVPGWCAQQDLAFYQDETVFRRVRNK